MDDIGLGRLARAAVEEAWLERFGRAGDCACWPVDSIGECTMDIDQTDWNDEGSDPIYKCSACGNSFSMDSEPMYCPCCGLRVIWD